MSMTIFTDAWLTLAGWIILSWRRQSLWIILDPFSGKWRHPRHKLGDPLTRWWSINPVNPVGLGSILGWLIAISLDLVSFQISRFSEPFGRLRSMTRGPGIEPGWVTSGVEIPPTTDDRRPTLPPPLKWFLWRSVTNRAVMKLNGLKVILWQFCCSRRNNKKGIKENFLGNFPSQTFYDCCFYFHCFIQTNN